MTEQPFKVGTVFRHGKWLADERTPGAVTAVPMGALTRQKAVCRVTAIRHGKVYYGFGAEARKGAMYQTAEKLLADGAEIIS